MARIVKTRIELWDAGMFPVMTGKDYGREEGACVPLALVLPHERQADRNHGQTLHRLAERGGLSACELAAVLEDREWRAMPEHEGWAAIFRAAVKAMPTEELRTLDTAERVCFYEQEFYVLSNFSSFKVSFAGIVFDTSEHAYHWNRFPHGSPERTIIRESASAHDAFRFAQENKHRQLPNWDALKVPTMREILRAKVRQHEYVRRKLLETGDRLLVENSWRDPYWGWGPNRDGQNMLGKLWMEVRAELARAVSPQLPTKVPA